jgi:hypothetical protein
MTPGRDLSAFQPPSRAVAVAPPPPPAEQPLGPTPSAPPAWNDDTPRRKVMTSVPAVLHRRLREAAEAAGQFKGDLVVEALRAHGGEPDPVPIAGRAADAPGWRTPPNASCT